MTEKKTDWHQNSPFESSGYTEELWLDSVERALNGADFNDTLVSRTLDGIDIQPLYTQNAEAPFHSRGAKEWSIQQSYNEGSISDVNKQILSDLGGGLTAVELALTSQLASTYLPCSNVEDLEQLLKGVHPQMIELSLQPSAENTVNGALVLAYYYRQKIAAEHIRCALNIDPLATLAATGSTAEKPLSDIAQFASHCANQFPNVSSLCADSSVYHNAGCSEAQELAYLLSTTVAYLREQTEHPQAAIDIDTAFRQIRFRLALDNDYFLSVAKLRATRELISQVASHCGAKDPKIIIDTITSNRSLSGLDPATNILRTSTQAAAAMAGGANGYNCAAYDSLSGKSTKANRLARNTHHILIEESGLLKVDDPARGSGYIESMTQSLCEAAWAIFQELETDGGMHQALLNGTVREQINKARVNRTEALSSGESAVVGVTDYPNLDDQVPEASTTTTKNLLKEVQPEASKISVTALIGALSDGENTLSFNTAYCQFSTVTAPIDSFRDAEVFEKLRARSDQYKINKGELPTAKLICLGTQRDYGARATFCKNFFAIAGINAELVERKNYVASANKEDKNQLLVICSSDKYYLSDATQVCESLTGQPLWIAGNHPKATLGLDKHGVTEKIHLGCNRVKLLDAALTLLGA